TTLDGANLQKAQVKDAIFLGVKGLTQKQIDDLEIRGAIVETVDKKNEDF
ncbi:MAG: hypothetical protein GY941_03155, partial [Planctomycetes bacterium]|nr:hypothetical protein [Planctomycetota bacterium]